jgi:Domain of unknown function (DUF4157)
MTKSTSQLRPDGHRASQPDDANLVGGKREGVLQRAAVSSNPPDSVPSHVNDVLSKPGRPLDTTVRQLMEPRFGRDFSQVRVHADAKAAESARQVGSLAYTVGQDLVFGHDQYRPHSGPGRLLIAHELAHSIQQGSGSVGSSEDTAREEEADKATASVVFSRPVTLSPGTAPAIQFKKISSGAFGKALEDFTNAWTIPDEALTLLWKSGTFRTDVGQIDSKYVYSLDFSDSTPVDVRPIPGPDGRIEKGKFVGKRVLFPVSFGEGGSFSTFGSPRGANTRDVEGDLITISERTSIPGFISELAHEVTHVVRFLGGGAAPAKTIVDEVDAAITDEIKTREGEAKIVGEIPDKDVKARASQVGFTDPARVERDFAPAVGLTYLEHFFFSARLREIKAKDSISDKEAEEIREQVNKDLESGTGGLYFKKPKPGPLRLSELSDYHQTWYSRGVAQREWKDFREKHKPSDPDFGAAKERLLENHATRFFEGRVRYKPLLIDI